MTKSYRRDPNGSCPFGPKESSGSHWSTDHLKYLQVDFTDNLRPEMVLPQIGGRNFEPDDRVMERLVDRLGMHWDKINDPDIRPSPEVYAGLRHLASINPPPPGSDIASSPMAPRDPEREKTPESSPAAPPSDELLAIQQNLAKRKASESPIEARKARAKPPPNLLRPPLYQGVVDGSNAQGTELDEDETSTQKASSSSDASQYQSEGDTPPRRSVGAGILPAESDAKPEKDVEKVMSSYVQEIENVLREELKPLNIIHTGAETLCVWVDGERYWTTADLRTSLQWKDKGNDKITDVLFECKGKRHGLSEDNILGQEVSHMLASATDHLTRRKKDYDAVTAYLVSWHHLDAYVSSVRVTMNYIKQLKKEPDELADVLDVKRSRILSLTNDGTRIALAKLVVNIIALQLYRYDSGKEFTNSIRQEI